MSSLSRRSTALCLNAAILAAMTASVLPALADNQTNFSTISTSGSTALRNFITDNSGAGNSCPLTIVEPGKPLQIGGYTWTASSDSIQPSPKDGTGILGGTSTLVYATQNGTGQYVRGARVEWHEQGSIEGILEMANSQIRSGLGFTGNASTGTLAPPLPNNNLTFGSNGNIIWVNNVKFTTTASANGYTANVQNPVQLAFSDVAAVQGFSVAGTPAMSNKVVKVGNTYTAQTGYGLGNPAAGTKREALPTAAALDHGTYTGTDGTDSKTIAITSTLFVANPGTGLTRIDRTDAQWLQTTGRLANGADFNMTTRDTNSGTRNVAALNTGVDPSWAGGESDNVASNATGNNIGTTGGMTFSGKNAGGGALRPTVINNRMAVGTLSSPDANTRTLSTSSKGALRALYYADKDKASVSNNDYVMSSAATITDGSYPLYQNESFVTLKTPVTAQNPTGILGDDQYGSVGNMMNNVFNSVKQFPNMSTYTTAADRLILNGYILPQMMMKGKFVDGSTTVDNNSTNQPYGDRTYVASARTDLLSDITRVNAYKNDDPWTVTTGTGNSTKYGNVEGSYLVSDPTGYNTTGYIDITKKNYFFGNFSQTQDANGDYATRDMASFKAALAAQKALINTSVAYNNLSMFGGNLNSTTVANYTANTASGSKTVSGLTKGDLIVMGDFDGDGKFDGKDLYLYARGGALGSSYTSDYITSGTGNTFNDNLRTAVLRKNDALAFLDSQTKTYTVSATDVNYQIRLAAAVNSSNEAVANAFNKLDVNRDGSITKADVDCVKNNLGKSISDLNAQLGVTDYDATGRQISLTAAKLLDENAAISNNDLKEFLKSTTAGAANAGKANVTTARDYLVHSVFNSRYGDTDWDGKITMDDYLALDTGYLFGGTVGWNSGDCNGDGVINASDYALIDAEFYNQSHGLASDIINLHASWFGADYAAQFDEQQSFAAVPEPASIALLALGGLSLLTRRRR